MSNQPTKPFDFTKAVLIHAVAAGITLASASAGTALSEKQPPSPNRRTKQAAG
jgi:hypothetical protein